MAASGIYGDRLLVVMSDIEMGAGGAKDDFPHSDWLGEQILAYNAAPYEKIPVDLVLNGDTFDLLKTAYLDKYPRHITRDVALGKMSSIVAAHPQFFAAIRRFVAHQGAERRVHFIVGNHDAELVIPEVQQLILSLCGGSERVSFPGFSVSFGRVYIEHGQQLDPMFRVEPTQPFVPYDGDDVLNVSWGSVALLDVVMELQPLLGFHDRLKPRSQVLELLPEFKEFLLARYWSYWTRDYWQGFFGTKDPTKKATWTMLKEIVWRWSAKETDITMEPTLQKRIMEDDTHLVHIIGHLHQPAIWSYGDRKLLQLGCLRNEYMLVDDGKSLRPIPKSFAEVHMRGDLPVASMLVERPCPPVPPDYIPASIFDVVPAIRDLLATLPGLDAAARKQQEAKEAAAGSSPRR